MRLFREVDRAIHLDLIEQAADLTLAAPVGGVVIEAGDVGGVSASLLETLFGSERVVSSDDDDPNI